MSFKFRVGLELQQLSQCCEKCHFPVLRFSLMMSSLSEYNLIHIIGLFKYSGGISGRVHHLPRKHKLSF